MLIFAFFYMTRGFWGAFLPTPPDAVGSHDVSSIVSIANTPAPLVAPIEINVYYPTQIVAPVVVPATGTPVSYGFIGYTPTVTKVPFLPSQVNYVFSYYYPDLIKEDYELYKANCHPDNVIYNASGGVAGCKDTTASGLPWSKYKMFYTSDKRYNGGVAVPYYPNTFNPLYPMGSVVRVTSPEIIAGDYLVIDICPACDDFVTDRNVLFLDFVAIGLPDGVNFWTPVIVSDVFYPWEVPAVTLVSPSTLTPSPVPSPTGTQVPDVSYP